MASCSFRAEVLAASRHIQQVHPQIREAWEPFRQRLLYFALKYEELESQCASLESECARLREGAGRRPRRCHNKIAGEHRQLRETQADLRAKVEEAEDGRQLWEVEARAAGERPAGAVPSRLWLEAADTTEVEARATGWGELVFAAPGTGQLRAAGREPPVVLMFPSGSRCYAGMLAGVRNLPAVREMAAKADAILAWERSILDVCVDGPAGEFENASRCVPAVFFASLVATALLRARRPAGGIPEGSVMLGDSHGVLAALCVAGAVSFEQGLSLAMHVGDVLDGALEIGTDAERIYIAGPNEEQLMEVCRVVRKQGRGQASCHIAGYPIRHGFIVAGSAQGISAFTTYATQHLPVTAIEPCYSTPAHTPTMKRFEPRLGSVLSKMAPQMRSLQHAVWVSTYAAPIRAGAGPDEVVKELKRYWSTPNCLVQTVDRMVGAGGFEYFCDVGPACPHDAHQMKHINRRVWAQMYKAHV